MIMTERVARELDDKALLYDVVGVQVELVHVNDKVLMFIPAIDKDGERLIARVKYMYIGDGEYERLNTISEYLDLLKQQARVVSYDFEFMRQDTSNRTRYMLGVGYELFDFNSKGEYGLIDEIHFNIVEVNMGSVNTVRLNWDLGADLRIKIEKALKEE